MGTGNKCTVIIQCNFNHNIPWTCQIDMDRLVDKFINYIYKIS